MYSVQDKVVILKKVERLCYYTCCFCSVGAHDRSVKEDGQAIYYILLKASKNQLQYCLKKSGLDVFNASSKKNVFNGACMISLKKTPPEEETPPKYM